MSIIIKDDHTLNLSSLRIENALEITSIVITNCNLKDNSIPEDFFMSFHHLTYLDLSYNKLSSPSFWIPDKVTKLILKGNPIISMDKFSTNNKLKYNLEEDNILFVLSNCNNVTNVMLNNYLMTSVNKVYNKLFNVIMEKYFHNIDSYVFNISNVFQKIRMLHNIEIIKNVIPYLNSDNKSILINETISYLNNENFNDENRSFLYNYYYEIFILTLLTLNSLQKMFNLNEVICISVFYDIRIRIHLNDKYIYQNMLKYAIDKKYENFIYHLFENIPEEFYIILPHAMITKYDIFKNKEKYNLIIKKLFSIIEVDIFDFEKYFELIINSSNYFLASLIIDSSNIDSLNKIMSYAYRTHNKWLMNKMLSSSKDFDKINHLEVCIELLTHQIITDKIYTNIDKLYIEDKHYLLDYIMKNNYYDNCNYKFDKFIDDVLIYILKKCDNIFVSIFIKKNLIKISNNLFDHFIDKVNFYEINNYGILDNIYKINKYKIDKIIDKFLLNYYNFANYTINIKFFSSFKLIILSSLKNNNSEDFLNNLIFKLIKQNKYLHLNFLFGLKNNIVDSLVYKELRSIEPYNTLCNNKLITICLRYYKNTIFFNQNKIKKIFNKSISSIVHYKIKLKNKNISNIFLAKILTYVDDFAFNEYKIHNILNNYETYISNISNIKNRRKHEIIVDDVGYNWFIGTEQYIDY